MLSSQFRDEEVDLGTESYKFGRLNFTYWLPDGFFHCDLRERTSKDPDECKNDGYVQPVGGGSRKRVMPLF